VENIELIFSGDEYFGKVLNYIQHAKKEILIESYIFHFDPIGIKILSALSAAQQRGVSVQLLIDGVGSFNSVRQIHDYCLNHHIPFRIYHPLPFELKILPKLSWRNLKRFLSAFKRINKRNHRKTIIVDRQHIFLGSFNISQVHSEHYMGNAYWRDTGALVSSLTPHDEIQNIALSFFHAWRRSRYFSTSNLKSYILNRKLKPKKKFRFFRLNSYAYWRFLLFQDLKKMIRNAKKRIYITNPYFLPRRSVLRQLQQAAQQGIEVIMILPLKSDVWLVRQATKSLYYRLLKAGIQIYEYKPRILHAKTLIIDEWAALGTHNLNHRSFIHDLEIDLVIQDRDQLGILLKKWEEDLSQSKRVSLKEFESFSFFEKMVSHFIYWFRYWL